jgi:short-subunit dehydrogenase
MRLQTWLRLGSAVAAGRRWASARRRGGGLAGQVVVLSGGTRGLGVALVREFAARGARLAVCARSAAELAELEREFAGSNTSVFTRRCDVARADEVRAFVEQVVQHFGRIDVLVNNAGIIAVQPAETVSTADLASGLDVNFWGTVHLTGTALPHLQARRGRLVNIASVGGVVPVPHLLPYVAAKHAVTGFSLALAAEEPGGVRVTTIVPGLMRTGSFGHALVKGDRAREAAWLSIAASLPLLTMSAERAARRIVRACERGERFVVLGLPAKALRLFHALLPSVSLATMRAANRYLLPAPAGAGPEQLPERAERHRHGAARSPLTAPGDRAQAGLRQSGPRSAEPPP